MRYRILAVLLMVLGLPLPALRASAADWERFHSAADSAFQRNDLVRADSLARLALAEVERAGLGDSLAFCTVADLIVHGSMRRGTFARDGALALGERVLARRTELLGARHPSIARSLDFVIPILAMSGERARADSLARHGLALREAAQGPDGPDVALSLNLLLNFASQRGELHQVLALSERILAIQARHHGADHWRTHRFSLNHAWALAQLGRVSSADSVLARALPVLESALGSDNYMVTYGLSTWGGVKHDLGDYAAAVRLREESTARASRGQGADSPALTGDLRVLAYSQRMLGDLVAARASLERAARLARGLPDAEGQRLYTWVSLAQARAQSGDTTAAIALLDEAVQHAERYLPRGRELREALLERAFLRSTLAHAESSRADLARAIALLDSSDERSTPRVSELRRREAEVLLRLGDRDGARLALEAAERTAKQHFPERHPAWAMQADLASAIAIATGDARGAWEAALRSEQASDAHLSLVFAGLSEREALRLADQRPRALDRLLATERPAAASIEAAWEAVATRRTRVLDALAERRHALLDQPGSDAARVRSRWRAASERVARLLVRGSEGRDPAEYATSLAEAQDALAVSERDLARHAPNSMREPVRLSALRAALPPRTALVAWVRLESLAPQTGEQFEHLVPEMHYGAFIHTPGPGAAQWISLGAAADVDGAVARWRAALELPAVRTPVTERLAEAGARAAGEDLRRRVWDPIAARIGRVEQVFVVLDGALQLVDLATLPDPAGGYLVERGPLLHTLTCERDLLRKPAEAALGRGLLAMGGADFDAGTTPLLAAAGPVFRGGPADCSEFATLRFEPLPASELEVREVASLWRDRPGGAVVHTGALADEARLKHEAAGHRVLHLATHGFFLGADCAPGSGTGRRGIGGTVAARAEVVPAGAAAPPFASASVGVTDGVVAGAHPLRLSGLAWAGANQRERTPAGGEDGVLTAEEVAALDLRGVEWAVLSGCDTGIGDALTGEGVQGLRRAFLAAGVRTVVMSLREVEDDAARDWMRTLHRERLAGRSTAAAVRSAHRAALATCRAAGESTHPFRWASFTATGDWR